MIRAAKFFIILYCEAIWIYYCFFIFSRVEWGMDTLPAIIYWLLPIILSLVILPFQKRPLLVYGISAALFLALIVHMWLNVLPSGMIGFSIFLTITICYLYFRGIYFLRTTILRKHILLRFEGNVVFYTFFVIYESFQGLPPLFHACFLLAFAASFIGMLFTLYPDELTHDDEFVQTKQTGNPGVLTAIITAVFSLGIAASLLFLLPQWRILIVQTLQTVWNAMKQMGSAILLAIERLLLLLPESDSELPDFSLQMGGLQNGEQLQEEVVAFTLPMTVIMIITAILLSSVAILLFYKLYRNRNKQRMFRHIPAVTRATKTSFFQLLKSLIMKGVAQLGKHFPFYYKMPIYYQYYKMARWGKKNGCRRLANETPKEYATKLIKHLPEHSKYSKEMILQTTDAFIETYYRESTRNGEFPQS